MHDTVGTRKTIPIALLLLLDILIAAFLVFAVYYIVYELPLFYPSNATATIDIPASQILSKTLSKTTSETSSPSPSEETAAADWKTKFPEHFSTKIVSTDMSYSSPNLSVDITKHRIGSGDNTVTYYVADIYMADISCFQTHFAHDTYEGQTQSLSDMSSEVGAILAMNGDSYRFNLKHLNGLLMRNGTVYRTNPTTADICVLYKDGTMVTSSPNDFNEQQTIANGALQTWVFGPKLLDGNGRALKQFNTWDYIRKSHPRSAIGYYEPGHYCFVVVDGRKTGYSRGMKLPELAAVFENLGCTAAYNLDGGHTTFMTLGSTVVNRPYKPTKTITDCLCICEPATNRNGE